MQENNSIIPIDFYLELINNMPHSVLVTNRNRKLIFYNKILKPTFGESIENLLGDTWVDYFEVYTVDRKHKFTIEDLPIARAIKGEMLIGCKMFIKGDTCKNGMYIKMCAYPILHNGEDITVIIFEDITDEQQTFDRVMDRLVELEGYLKKELDINNNDKNY